jgi:serine acetyltransferase
MKSKSFDPAMPIAARAVIGFHRLHRRTYLSRNFIVRKIVCKLLSAFNQLVIQPVFHCILPKEADIGKNFMMPHPFGVLISPNARIGDNVKIMHHVTLGHNEFSRTPISHIIVEDNVYIAPGALILSNALTIGRGSVIGPNVVVFRDVPPGSVMIGMPARNVGQPEKEESQPQ